MLDRYDEALRRGRVAGLVLAVLLAGGCSAGGEVLHLPGDHPAHPGAPAAPAAPATVYTCPMHPEVVSDAPGRCPKCNMNLVPKSGGKGGER